MKLTSKLFEKCPVCQIKTEHHLLLSAKHDEHAIYRCSVCQLTRVLPLPSSTIWSETLQGMYVDFSQAFSQQKYDLASNSAKSYLRHLKHLGRGKPLTLVDLAGGLGYYSLAFAHQGLEVTYVDIDSVSVGFVHRCSSGSVKVFQSSLEDFCEQAIQKYDIIFFRHVIEHCLRPDKILELIRRLAHQHTVLILETDNNLGIEIFFHPEASNYWLNFYRDNYGENSVLKLCRMRPLAVGLNHTHYYAFRPKNLCSLLKKTSWQPLDVSLYALGDSTYWPNCKSANDFQWWRPRRDVRSWIKELIYYFSSSLLKLFKWTSGIVVYASPKDFG